MAEGARNWKFAADGMNGSVFPTSEPIDDKIVFDRFAKARDALANWFNCVALAYYDESLKARRLTKIQAMAQLPPQKGQEARHDEHQDQAARRRPEDRP
jgi:hypothetical protein